MRRSVRRPTEAPGQDSFLDIVANLVGILIILVMVVGARAKDAMIEVTTSVSKEDEEEKTEPVDLETPQATATALEADFRRLQANIERQKREVTYRTLERNRLLTMVKRLEQQLGEKKNDLDEAQRATLEVRSRIAVASSELEQLEKDRKAVAESEAAPVTLKHLPTPMAKTVFGKEIHFRLKGGRVAHVPFRAFLDKFRQDAARKMKRLHHSPSVTETIGPLEGFRMRYHLRRGERRIETGAGTLLQKYGELDYFELVPVAEELGERLDSAFREDSRFRSVLSGHARQQTTVTIWVYPDSFADYRKLKQYLFELGFLTAARPLPDSELIGGSPRGNRSAAQ